jgi:hypothetical protein
VIQQKIEYIHNNPVEEGFVFRPEDYKYSSAPLPRESLRVVRVDYKDVFQFCVFTKSQLKNY